MSGLGLDGQAACTVECQIRLGKDHSIDIVVVDGHIFPTIRQSVVCPLRQSNKDLIRFQGIDSSESTAGDVRARENELHLVSFPGIYYDLAIIESTRKNIDALCSYDNLAPLYGNCIGVTRGAVSSQLNSNSRALVISSLQVPVAKQAGGIDGRTCGSCCLLRGGSLRNR